MNPSPVREAGKHRILVVDDDSVTRMLIVHHLRRSGFEVLSAEGVTEAKAQIEKLHAKTVDAVVTDYLMPDGTGLELIEWLKQADGALAAIVVTAVGESDLVKQSLRGGACDFLDKPVQIDALLKAVRNATEQTERNRHLKQTESEVEEVGRFQQFMLGTGSEGFNTPLEVCWHPKHPVGGDLVNILRLGPKKLLVLVADVSGHDLKAGFISAFFQGVVRGMVEKQTPVEEIFAYFNRFLTSEWSKSLNASHGAESVAASISACAFVIDFADKRLSVFNSGFPVPIFTNRDGRSEPCGQRPGFPLGWFDDNPIDATERDISEGGTLYIWTDGLEDLAAQLGANPISVATELLSARREGRVAECLKLANDDVLLVRLNLNESGSSEEPSTPLIYQELQSGQESQIDDFQANWSKSLQLAFPGLPEDKLFDFLLCSREAVINAIRYGCDETNDGRTTFEVACDPGKTRLRVVVNDRGPGHDFSWESHLGTSAENLADCHRGLALIHQVPTATRIDRNGAQVTMDFSLFKP